VPCYSFALAAFCCSLSGEAIRPEVRLAVMFRYLAGGATEDLRMIYGVSYGEVYSSMWRAVDAVNRALVGEFPLNDPAKL
jgi:DNA-directed RNA polymerase specialized sigma24 family protein